MDKNEERQIESLEALKSIRRILMWISGLILLIAMDVCSISQATKHLIK